MIEEPSDKTTEDHSPRRERANDVSPDAWSSPPKGRVTPTCGSNGPIGPISKKDAKPRRSKIPPIFISSEGKWRTLSQDLGKICSHEFKARITRHCNKQKFTFRSFLLDSEKPESYLARGLDPESSNDVLLSLQEGGYQVPKARHLSQRRDGVKLPLWKMDMPSIPESAKILELTTLDLLRVKVEKYRARGASKHTICYRC